MHASIFLPSQIRPICSAAVALLSVLAVPVLRGAPGDVDTTLNAGLNPAQGTTPTGVQALATQPDGQLLFGGTFNQSGTVTRYAFARLTAAAALDLTFNPNSTGNPFNFGSVDSCTVQPDGKIFVGGGFPNFGGVQNNGAVRVNANGTMETTFNPAGAVYVSACTIQPDGKLLIGGGFDTIGGVARRGIARLNVNGTVDTSFTATANNGSVMCISLQPDGKVILSGSFTSINGTTRKAVARLNSNGSLDTTFSNPDIGDRTGDDVSCTVLQVDGKILIGGHFAAVAGSTRNNFARLNTNGSLDSSYNPNANNRVLTMSLQCDGKLIAGGWFTSMRGTTRRYLARLNADGTLDNAFTVNGVGMGADVARTCIQADGKVVVGGYFQTAGGVARNALVRLINDPATQALSAQGQTRIQWLRGGSSPETHYVNFELSTDSGGSWSPLGDGARITGGWEKTGLTLPSAGSIRARARNCSGSSTGIVESVATFAFPEIAVYSGSNTSAPELTDGQSGTITFPAARVGATNAPELNFTISSKGALPLRVTGVALPNGYTLLNPPAFPVDVAVSSSLTFAVQLSTAATGTFAGQMVIFSNDTDETAFNLPVTGIIVAPEIAVHDGTAITAPALEDGQDAAVEFGTTRLATPVVRSFTITNTGTAPLLLGAATVPAGFAIQNGPVFPAVVDIGGTLTLDLRLDAAVLGNFSGSVIIANDDADESPFDFIVSGTVITPEIGLHDGTAAGAELSDGQLGRVNFGRNVQGTPATRSLTIANTGTAPLLVGSITLPPGYTALNAPALPLTIPASQTAGFQVSLTTLTVGTHSGSVVIASDDLDEASFDFPVTGEVFIPDPVATPPANAAAGLNRQTGLREQTIHITNDTTATVPAYNLIVRGLPAGVEVNNASSQRVDGSWVIYVRRPMDPHAAQDILLEYFSATRLPAEFMPQLSTEVVLVPPDLSVPGAAATFRIDVVKAVPGGVLIEFPTTPGHRYQVQYSADGTHWQSSLPSINAVANRTQWVDQGLPRTDNPPSAEVSRFYRVAELAPQ